MKSLGLAVRIKKRRVCRRRMDSFPEHRMRGIITSTLMIVTRRKNEALVGILSQVRCFSRAV